MQTLQSFCLNRIATSFDRYHYVYSTTKNEDLQGALLFLQRFYSHELVTRLNRGYRLKEKHADFIFNKFLKYMDTDWLTNFSWDGIVNIFERIGPNLEWARFRNGRGLPWKDVVCNLSEVKILIYYYCRDDFLQNVAEFCHKVISLSVAGRGVTDRGLKYFCGSLKGKKRKRGAEEEEEADVPCPSLREIYLIRTAVGREAIELLLKHLRSLQRIDHANLPKILHQIHERDLLSLDRVQSCSLTFLDLSGCTNYALTAYYDEILKISITLCPKLAVLACTVVNAEQLALISQLPDLEILALNCDRSLDLSDLLKRRGEKLTRLNIRGCSVSLSALRQYCRSVFMMMLYEVTFHSKHEDYNFVLSSLKYLTCVNLVDYKAVCNILACSPVLEELRFLHLRSSDVERGERFMLQCCKATVARNVSFKNDTGIDVRADFVKEVLLICPTIRELTFSARHGLQDVRRFAKTLTNRPRIKIKMEKDSRVKLEVDP